MFTLRNVLEGTGGRLVGKAASAMFSGVAIDSRTVRQGDLFVAFRGQQHDGHHFVSQAFARGASGALVEWLPDDLPWATPNWDGEPVIVTRSTGQALQDLARYWRCQHNLTVVGVTGSVGKTTTKELIASVLAERFSVVRSSANLNTEIGLPMALMQVDDSHQVAVLEMAMHDVGEIRRLARIAVPDVGVVTNVKHTHLERLGSLQRVADAKSEIIEELKPSGVAVLNADDERVRAMGSRAAGGVCLYGMASDADPRALAIRSNGLRGIEFDVVHRGQRLHATMRAAGAHLVHAALAALAVALSMGMSIEDAVAALEVVDPDLRLSVVAGFAGSTVLDDSYNASPTSVLAALDLLAEMEGRRVAVLGDMLELGSFEEEGHRLVGQRAAEVVHWLVTVGKRAQVIAQEARASGLPPEAVESADRNDEVIARLQSGLRRDDFVLIKGSRGMRLDEVANAIRVAS
ncbi:MAG: UDP-N-acetylmuramoyl-tripeptide--D-alanyl-D-alanine ligase [Chloroflexi bacterium]|nr:UDP-N-acetylmuramoyl-tripeptide--D-alanyl-D-alanine ligase [Chloroflexota bacterium]